MDQTYVLSDRDTALFYQALNDLSTAIEPFVPLITEMEGFIEALGFKDAFCAAFQTIVTITNTFMEKAYACSAVCIPIVPPSVWN